MTVVIRVFCERCGQEGHNEQKKCVKCGKKHLVERRIASCPACGSVYRKDDNFCAACGHDLRAYKQTVHAYCDACGFTLGEGANYCYMCGAPQA